MKSIVITGSTRGIGYGLADAFLDAGCMVTISGRSQADVDSAIAQLNKAHGPDRLHGCPCDVTQLDQLEKLWESAKNRFGQIDIWINNAGIGHPLTPMWELPPERLSAVVDTNVTGVIFGSRVAIRGMLEQGHGQLYNMLGQGARGNARHGMSVYGSTKSAVYFLSKALVHETEGTPVQVGTLSPGMVMTDLLLDRLEEDPEILARSKRIFNILADRAETVCPWMVGKILTNKRSGVEINWLTRHKMLWRFITATFNKRDLFNETSMGRI